MRRWFIISPLKSLIIANQRRIQSNFSVEKLQISVALRFFTGHRRFSGKLYRKPVRPCLKTADTALKGQGTDAQLRQAIASEGHTQFEERSGYERTRRKDLLAREQLASRKQNDG